MAAKQRLAALLGQDQIDFPSFAGNIEDLKPLGEFEGVFDKLLAGHPELSAAIANVERSRRDLAQQIATPISDFTWQTNVLYDFTNDLGQ